MAHVRCKSKSNKPGTQTWSGTIASIGVIPARVCSSEPGGATWDCKIFSRFVIRSFMPDLHKGKRVYIHRILGAKRPQQILMYIRPL